MQSVKITTADAMPTLYFDVLIITILYIYNYYEALPYELLKCFSADVRFTLGKCHVLRAFNIFCQSFLLPFSECFRWSASSSVTENKYKESDSAIGKIDLALKKI